MIYRYGEVAPSLGEGAYVARSAEVIGDVHLGEASSVWYGTVVRGDVGKIRIGVRTNLQDQCVVHVTSERFDTFVGDDVTVGHRAILHGCRVDDHVLVGMGAIILDGAEIEPWSMIGAGALVAPGTRVPEGSLVLGVPARVKRALTESERAMIVESGRHYVELATKHRRDVVEV